jgi:hypothetical protein
MQVLVNTFIISIVWRPLIIQKVINYLLAYEKSQIVIFVPQQKPQANGILTSNKTSTSSCIQMHHSQTLIEGAKHKRCLGLKCKYYATLEYCDTH